MVTATLSARGWEEKFRGKKRKLFSLQSQPFFYFSYRVSTTWLLNQKMKNANLCALHRFGVFSPFFQRQMIIVSPLFAGKKAFFLQSHIEMSAWKCVCFSRCITKLIVIVLTQSHEKRTFSIGGKNSIASTHCSASL